MCKSVRVSYSSMQRALASLRPHPKRPVFYGDPVPSNTVDMDEYAKDSEAAGHDEVEREEVVKSKAEVDHGVRSKLDKQTSSTGLPTWGGL